MVEPLELGRFISTCRKEKNLTQKQLGEELGVTDRAVSKWENGKSFPDISLIEPLCQILDISVGEFMLGKRIEPEHYQEETEKAWIASLDEPLLYKIQMIIYILGIAAVAVLLIHIERNAVTPKRYNTAMDSFPLDNAIILLAIKWSNF